MSNVPQDEQQSLLDLARDAGFKVRNGALDADGKGVLETLARLLQLRDQRAGGEAVAWAVESIGNPDTQFGRIKAFETELGARARAKELFECGFDDVKVYPLCAQPQPALDWTAGMMKADEYVQELLQIMDWAGTGDTESAENKEKEYRQKWQAILAAIPADARVPFGYVKLDPKWGETRHTGMAIFSEKVDDHVVPVYL
jgi:hypothetical protein